jgi:hypothetical protein
VAGRPVRRRGEKRCDDGPGQRTSVDFLGVVRPLSVGSLFPPAGILAVNRRYICDDDDDDNNINDKHVDSARLHSSIFGPLVVDCGGGLSRLFQLRRNEPARQLVRAGRLGSSGLPRYGSLRTFLVVVAGDGWACVSFLLSWFLLLLKLFRPCLCSPQQRPIAPIDATATTCIVSSHQMLPPLHRTYTARLADQLGRHYQLHSVQRQHEQHVPGLRQVHLGRLRGAQAVAHQLGTVGQQGSHVQGYVSRRRCRCCCWLSSLLVE